MVWNSFDFFFDKWESWHWHTANHWRTMTWVHFLGVNPRPQPRSWPAPKHNIHSVPSNLMIYLTGAVFFCPQKGSECRQCDFVGRFMSPHCERCIYTLRSCRAAEKALKNKKKILFNVHFAVLSDIQSVSIFFLHLLSIDSWWNFMYLVNHEDIKSYSHFLSFIYHPWHHLLLLRSLTSFTSENSI